MKEVWVPVKLKHFKHYSVSNYGHLKNRFGHITSGHVYRVSPVRGPLLMFSLNSKKHTKNISAHKLVFTHFKTEQLSLKYAVWHNDLNGTNNEVTNLHKMSRGDILRMTFRNRKQPRGVYSYNVPNSKNKFRAVLKVDHKVITLGYTKTKAEAVQLYKQKYKEIYGVEAY